jgi:hypothetical protein
VKSRLPCLAATCFFICGGAGQGQYPERLATLYETDRETYLVQGYVVTDPEALSQMRIPAGETVVEVPKRLMKYLPEEQHGEGHG